MATPVDEYLSALPEARRDAVTAVLEVVRANLPAGYEEGIQYGSIGWFVPHSVCAAGYHCDAKQPVPFAGLASGKSKISLHLFGMYIQPEKAEAFVAAWKATNKKLDMGKSCVRFKSAADVPLDVVGDLIASMPMREFLERYEASLSDKVKKKRAPA